MDFYYRYGSVETNRKWDRPSWDVFYQWWEEAKTIEGVEHYDFYVVGGCLFDIENTWDIDINIVGEIKDPGQLGYILHTFRDLALNKYGIFVDPFWMSSIKYCYEPPIYENMKFYIRATLTGDEVKIRDGETVLDRKLAGDRHGTEMNEYPLTFQLIRYPQPKHLKKPEGYNEKPPVLLKK